MNFVKKAMYLLLLLVLLLASDYYSHCFSYNFDVSVFGVGNYTEALGRLPIITIDALKDSVKVNFGRASFIPHHIKPDVLSIMKNPDRSCGAVALMYHFTPEELKRCESALKIFYTMFDSTEIPAGYGAVISSNFDAVVVPDPWLIDVYKRGGVTIPIFVLPCLMYLEQFLKLPAKTRDPKKPFVFGSSGAYVERKNQVALVDAFIKEFGNNPAVKLKLHGRRAKDDRDETLRQKIQEAQVTNIEIINKIFTQQEYNDFLYSLDCYVYLSKGEGFSITPREALACGIPCIVSNNTAHTTLCSTGFVRAVPSGILETSHYCNNCGYFFNCTIEDARAALRDVYVNYSKHVTLAKAGREWIRNFDYTIQKYYYLSLVKPKQVILGTENKIERKFLMTNSPALLNKYKELETVQAHNTQDKLKRSQEHILT